MSSHEKLLKEDTKLIENLTKKLNKIKDINSVNKKTIVKKERIDLENKVIVYQNKIQELQDIYDNLVEEEIDTTGGLIITYIDNLKNYIETLKFVINALKFFESN